MQRTQPSVEDMEDKVCLGTRKSQGAGTEERTPSPFILRELPHDFLPCEDAGILIPILVLSSLNSQSKELTVFLLLQDPERKECLEERWGGREVKWGLLLSILTG